MHTPDQQPRQSRLAIGKDGEDGGMHTTTPNIISSKPLFKPRGGGSSGFKAGPAIGISSSATKPMSSMKPGFVIKKKEFKMAAPT